MENRKRGTNTAMCPSEVNPSSRCPHPHWNTATSRPYEAPTDSRFMTTAFSGRISERNAITSNRKDSASTVPTTAGR